MPFLVQIEIEERADGMVGQLIKAYPEKPTKSEMKVFKALVDFLESPKPGFEEHKVIISTLPKDADQN